MSSVSEERTHKKESSKMYQLLLDLYPLHRTINSDDFEKSLKIIGDYLGPKYFINEYKPGTDAFTWVVPKRYHVKEAYIEYQGKRYADFSENNLSLVSYSVPVDKTVSYEELKEHIYTSPAQPDEIPWVFKYYQKDWGFCLAENIWKNFDKEGEYKVVINSSFGDEPFMVGEFVVPGKTDEEILWISDICHPNQVNDSLSGAVVAAEVAKKYSENYSGKYTLRFLFLAETIGSMTWFSRNEDKIPKIKHGLFCEMLGNNNRLLLKKSLQDTASIDRVAERVLKKYSKCGSVEVIPFKKLEPGNDENIMNGLGIGIPAVSITRWPYPEYHSTADNPDLINIENLEEAMSACEEIIETLNTEKYPLYLSKGPIFLSRYDLWVDWRVQPELNAAIERLLLLLDGKHSVTDIAEEVNLDIDVVHDYLKKIEAQGLIKWC